LFQISKILSDIEPVLYELIDLKKAAVPGKYYKQQLTKSPPPKEVEYFFIESVLKQKKIRGKLYYLVKYLYYPSKFNRWLPEENVVRK